MNITNFIHRFPDEAACLEFIKQASKQGFNKGLSAKGVAILSITGLKKRNPFSVLHAILEPV